MLTVYGLYFGQNARSKAAALVELLFPLGYQAYMPEVFWIIIWSQVFFFCFTSVILELTRDHVSAIF